MKELNEIRLGESVTILKDNLVKTTVLPKTSAKLDRDIIVQGNVRVEGAIYARNLIIDRAPAEFLSSVYAHNELHIKNDAAQNVEETIIFNKAVESSGSVVSYLIKGRCIYGADISAANVKLKNCFIAGSIFAQEIQIEDSVVLGGVFASKKLSLHNTICSTFHASETAAGGINYLLYPTAFSAEPIALLPGTEFYNITLADLGSLFKVEPEKPGSGKIRMDFEADVQRSELVDDEGIKIILHSYSVAKRVLTSDLLDSSDFENHFLILAASLNSRILKAYSLQKTDGGGSDELTLPRIAKFFFTIISGATQIQDLSGSISFDELRKCYL